MRQAYASLAPLYDRFMADVDYGAWTDYIEALIARFLPGCPAPHIAECACGTGEMTLCLLKRGYRVTASDISEEMLAVAREKLRMAGFPASPLVLQDMRALSLHHPVDAVLAVCDAVNYLPADADALRFFKSAHGVLREGGLLLFDVSSAYKLQSVLGGKAFGEARKDCAYVWQNIYDEETHLLALDLTLFTKRGDGAYARSEETQVQRAYEADELKNLLNQSGFSVLGCYDAFTMNGADARSERIQFAARRL